MVAAEFIVAQKKAGRRQWHEQERLLKFDVLPQWSGRPADTINGDDIYALTTKIAGRAGYVSNRVLSVIKRLYTWAVATRRLTVNPTLGLEPVAEEVERERALSPAEIKTLWRALDTVPKQRLTDTVRALILTGTRRDEARLMRWEEITDLDGDEPTWRLPAKRTKNAREHIVPLCPQMVELLLRQPTRKGAVFAGPKGNPSNGRARGSRR